MKRLALALAALVVGAACIVLGLAALGERRSLDRAHAALAAMDTPRETRGDGVASTLLATGGDWQAVAAAADVAAGRAPASHQRALESLASGGPAAVRSWASTLLAADTLDSGRVTAQQVQAAVTSLQDAIAADSRNEDAKRDLELLLTLQRKRGKSGSSAQGQGGARRHTRLQRAAARSAGRTHAGTGW